MASLLDLGSTLMSLASTSIDRRAALVTRRLLKIHVAVELATIPLLTIGYAAIAGVDWSIWLRILIPLFVFAALQRLALVYWTASASFRELDRLPPKLEDANLESLVRADLSLRRYPSLYGQLEALGLGWPLPLATLLLVFFVPEHELSTRIWSMTLLETLVCIVAPLSFTSLLARYVFAPTTAELSTALGQRLVRPKLAYRSLASSALFTALSCFLVCLVWVVILGMLAQDAERAEHAAEQAAASLSRRLEAPGVEVFERGPTGDYRGRDLGQSHPGLIPMLRESRAQQLRLPGWELAVHSEPTPEGGSRIAVVRYAPPRWSLAGLMGFFIFALLVYCALVSVFFAKVKLKPLEDLRAAWHDDLGQGRFSQRGLLPIAAGDEIGLLTIAFNQSLLELKAVTETLDAVRRGRLDVSCEAVGEIASGLSGLVTELESYTRSSRSQALGLEGAGADLSAAIAEQDEAVRQQSTSIVALIAAMRTFKSGLHAVDDAVREILRVSNQSQARAEEAERQVGTLTESISGIEGSLAELSVFSRRSRLLAINASVEAARAGGLIGDPMKAWRGRQRVESRCEERGLGWSGFSRRAAEPQRC
jgi:methyl-accepting chemotaxis protein